MRLIARSAAGLGVLFALTIVVLAFPGPLFGYSMNHGNFEVRSDRPIDPAMTGVLDDAMRRLRTSALHDPEARFRIFICNEPWRLFIYTRGTTVGGVTDTLITRNIYLREVDAASNRLVPPSGRLADANVRTLSYFVAHEATHVMQSRAFGRLLRAWYPGWLVEGHADLVAKAGEFHFDENRRLLRAGDRRLDYARSGLYRRYHLMVAMLLERGHSIRDIFANPPDGDEVIHELTFANGVSRQTGTRHPRG